MKNTSHIHSFFVVIFLLILSLAYSQDKKQHENTLFGKQKKTENKNPKNEKIRCATTEYEQFLQEKNPKRMTDSQFESWLTPLVKKHKAMRTASKVSATIIT